MSCVVRTMAAGAAIVTGLSFAVAGYLMTSQIPQPGPRDASPSPITGTGSTGGVRVVERIDDVAGYDRDCGSGHACVFGTAWSDDTSAPLSHNGCDTRNDIRRTQLRDIQIKPGTRGCVVTAGTLIDPYDGRTVYYVKGQNPVQIQVDHVIPLNLAWNAGAHTWTAQKRAAFANDPRNLWVASSHTNRAKSDQAPAEWATQIEDPDRRCAFLQQARLVVQLYGLPVTTDDAAAFAGCGETSSTVRR